jgi:hypothetical protein
MAIKITKKRNVAAPARPEPLVEPAATEIYVPPPLQPYKEPTLCSFCRHPYIEPCHGKSDRCMNAQWKRERMEKEKGQ